MNEIWNSLVSELTFIEAIAAVFGLLAVYWNAKQNIYCWPAGLIQVILYVFVFYNSFLYSDFILHIIYIGLQIGGWYHWLNGGNPNDSDSTLKVTTYSTSNFILWLLLGTIITAAWGTFMQLQTQADFPYGDAFTTAFSLIAYWFMIKKKLETWYLWIVVDIVAIPIYLYKGLYITATLYTVFLTICVMGLLDWRKDYLENTST